MSEQDKIGPALAAEILAEFEKDWRKELRRAVPVKERVKIARRPMPQRPPAERSKDFAEVNLGLSAEEAVAEARRCLDCAKPGCIAGCPVRIDIPTFVKLVEKGEFAAAAAKVREANSLPAVCGRVCPQETQCEETCQLRKATGVPVAIGNLERFVSDVERTRGGAVLSRTFPRRPDTRWPSSGPARPA